MQARLLILCARFFLSKPQTKFAVWVFLCKFDTTSQSASQTAPLKGEPWIFAPRKKVQIIQIFTVPSIDGNRSKATSIKFDTPVSGGA